MTDEELKKLLRGKKADFYNTVDFTSPRFNTWIKEKGYESRRPVFSNKYCFRGRSTLASIVNHYHACLIEESIEYPITIGVHGIGSLFIYETKLLNGKLRRIMTEDGFKEVIDDYFVNHVAHRVLYSKPSFGEQSPYMVVHKGRKMYARILRQVAKRHPKGKFYPFRKTY